MAKQTIKQRKVWVNECDRAAFAAEPVYRHREMVQSDLGQPAPPLPKPEILYADSWEEAARITATALPHQTISLPKTAPLYARRWWQFWRAV